jgi:hypothetical protein
MLQHPKDEPVVQYRHERPCASSYCRSKRRRGLASAAGLTLCCTHYAPAVNPDLLSKHFLKSPELVASHARRIAARSPWQLWTVEDHVISGVVCRALWK